MYERIHSKAAKKIREFIETHSINQTFSFKMANFLRSLFRRGTVAINLSEPMKMVLVVRNDLNLGRGKIGAQCAHGAVICCENATKQNPAVLKTWLNLGQPKVVLRVNTLSELRAIQRDAKKIGVNHGVVQDAGRTQVEAGTVTVLALGPDTVKNIDSLTGHLKLL